MKPARSTLPEPASAVTCGIDWARDNHAVSVVDAHGHEISWCTIGHSAAGLGGLLAVPARVGAGEVTIERPDSPVTDTLSRAGVTAVAATVALRRACRARKDLVSHRVAGANQLRAHLRNVLPGAAVLFASIGSSVSLAFLACFGTQDQADWLTPARLGKWLADIGRSGGTEPAVLHARLTATPRGITRSATAQVPITRALDAGPLTLTEQIRVLSAQISAQLAAHADGHAFTSLPHSGTVRAVTFRWSGDKQLRDAVTDFACDARHASRWTAGLY